MVYKGNFLEVDYVTLKLYSMCDLLPPKTFRYKTTLLVLYLSGCIEFLNGVWFILNVIYEQFMVSWWSQMVQTEWKYSFGSVVSSTFCRLERLLLSWRIASVVCLNSCPLEWTPPPSKKTPSNIFQTTPVALNTSLLSICTLSMLQTLTETFRDSNTNVQKQKSTFSYFL